MAELAPGTKLWYVLNFLNLVGMRPSNSVIPVSA
jgi:hypothetical protein